MTIGANIRAHREAATMTTQQLADRLHIDTMMVESWEADEYLPSVPMMAVLADMFHVTLKAVSEIRTSAAPPDPPEPVVEAKIVDTPRRRVSGANLELRKAVTTALKKWRTF